MASPFEIKPQHSSTGIAAIYDIVWLANSFRERTRANKFAVRGKERVQYRAELRFEGRESVYGCDEKLFQNFNILSLPPASTFHLSPLPIPSPTPAPSPTDFIPLTSPSPSNPGTLDLTFTAPTADSDGYPFLHFQYQFSTKMLDDRGEKLQMCAVGWAKRREYDDEVPTGRDTCLSDVERESLVRRREIDMVALEGRLSSGMNRMEGLEEGEVME
ncbi:hypothetical protein ONS95_003345 [Cadophora gregata]|uniref:uncharacterized protein n=1 Tax=Cadophora gregata TaxID=51156 RepID=UPI0026DAC3D6|nr:uncharacterized protein ONS95_003345 [Cadophora gregata]KAK0108544.1 hypothetical protein ONS95_003345 [Cadophora gregata]KAK0108863.1 hypothetical protein ONS96_002701 [Cadophora gregata f. sp. sojae]